MPRLIVNVQPSAGQYATSKSSFLNSMYAVFAVQRASPNDKLVFYCPECAVREFGLSR